MDYEITALSCGEGNADAFLIVWGHFGGGRDEITVVVYDTGLKAQAEQIAKRLDREFDTSVIDIWIGSHLDSDHISSYGHLLQEGLEIGQTWLHDPWQHRHAINVTASIDNAVDVLESAGRLVEPFKGLKTDDGVLEVLGPTVEYYEELLPKFFKPEDLEKMTAVRAAATTDEGVITRILALGTLDTYDSSDPETVLPPAKWSSDNLLDSPTTEAPNSTSVLAFFDFDDKQLLLTGDAGVEAIEKAAEAIVESGYAPGKSVLLQVPHHGSINNLNSRCADILAGTIVAESDEDSRGTAIISAAGKVGHPSDRIINAVKRRGWRVLVTRQHGWRWRRPKSAGTTKAEPRPAEQFVGQPKS